MMKNKNQVLSRKKGKLEIMAKEKKKPPVLKSTLIIRLVAGMYLLYLSYELYTGMEAEGGAPAAVSIGCMILFVLCGLTMVIFSGRDFLKGNYEGAAVKQSEEKEEKKS